MSFPAFLGWIMLGTLGLFVTSVIGALLLGVISAICDRAERYFKWIPLAPFLSLDRKTKELDEVTEMQTEVMRLIPIGRKHGLVLLRRRPRKEES